jgi:creatinine amidohydrolase
MSAITSNNFSARPHILEEANYAQLQELKPNVAVLPWGATEAHNYHMPHGTDNIEATRLGETAVARANASGARCVLLPAIPYGIDHSQLDQVATITMRASTQRLILLDIAESLVRQNIQRLVVLNFHGGNEFKSLLRDVMFEFPIFIVQINGHQLAPQIKKETIENAGDHADEFETSLLLHLCPELINLKIAGDGATTPSVLPALTRTPGVWCSRDWSTLSKDTGSGDPRLATAEKGRVLFEALVNEVTPVLIELSKAQNGEFPFIVREPTK